MISLFEYPQSKPGHVYANLFLLLLLEWVSVVVHEFGHALVGNLVGLKIAGIWIGRGRVFYRANIFGFDTEFRRIPFGGFTLLRHGPQTKLRHRYFTAILAGPLANLVILVLASRFASWRQFNFESSIQFAAVLAIVQVIILVENLLPYRVRSAVGLICTDGLSLFQLAVSDSPDVLRQPIGHRTVLRDS